MARPIVLSNGALHVGINLYGEVHDLYYPYVGLENHCTTHNMRHKIGVWTEGKFSWLDDTSWEFVHDYESKALIGRIQAINKDLGVTLEFQDAVDSDSNTFMRNIHVINAVDKPREVRLFLHQVFRISNSLNGDTVQYLPDEKAVLHYKGHRVFVTGAMRSNGDIFDQFATGVYAVEGKEGTFKDAEDGLLSGNMVEQGASVDSVLGFNLDLEAHGSDRVAYWLTAAKNTNEAIDLHHKIRETGIHDRMRATHRYWAEWMAPAERFIGTIDNELQEPFRKSLLILKSHMDNRGAVMASTDTTVMNYSRDAYVYCWPRDASFALWPLVRLGYTDELKAYFEFCRRALHPDGFLMHKYQADGALGSSWHPYVYAGRTVPPIQEDESAIVVFLFGQYYQITQDTEMLQKYYDTLIRPIGKYMAETINEATKLPHASYNLWEEKFQTNTYSVAVTYAALLAAAHMARELHRDKDAEQWEQVAKDIRTAAQTQLFNEERGFFYCGFLTEKQEDGTLKYNYDETIDMSAFYGAFMFGLFDIDGELMKKAVATAKNVFGLDKDEVVPIRRYERDQYFTVDAAGLGNPWFIVTLWYAQYSIEVGDHDKAEDIVYWVKDKMMKTGVLSEQMNPFNNKFIGVAPLAWSQAEFINSVIDLMSDPNR